MDLNKLREIYTNKLYTDIELVFYNDTHKVTIYAHKAILASSCEFCKMFDFGADITTTKIFVKNPDLARDIVNSFYGIETNSTTYTKWQYILEMFKMRDFFCLNNDVQLLHNLTVDPEGFDLFLEVASQFDMVKDRKLLKKLNKICWKNMIWRDLTNHLLKYYKKNLIELFLVVLIQISNYGTLTMAFYYIL